MTAPLAWDGRGPIVEAPERVGPALVATHTLLEREGAYWASLASRVRDAHGGHGALAGGPASSRIVTPDVEILPVPATMDVFHAALMPAVVQVLRAIDVIPDLGWVAVVAGGGVKAELLSCLVLRDGVRRTIRVTVGDDEVGQVPADETIGGAAVQQGELLGRLRLAPAPVVAFETRGDSVTQLALLDALPAGSHLVLLESACPGARASIDFYSSVHRKNATVHGIPRIHPHDVRRCDRAMQLLRTAMLDAWRPDVTRVSAQGGLVPPAAGRLLLVTWPEG